MSETGYNLTEEMLKLHNFASTPRAVRVWCIERPRYYHDLKIALCPPTIGPQSPQSFFGRLLFGIPITRCTLDEIELEEKHLLADPETSEGIRCAIKGGKLFPFRAPGVWVEMANAPHIKLEEDNHDNRS